MYRKKASASNKLLQCYPLARELQVVISILITWNHISKTREPKPMEDDYAQHSADCCRSTPDVEYHLGVLHIVLSCGH